MPEVDYKALCISLSRQNGDLALTVDSYQREIIPKYESLLKKARAERDNLADELSKALSVLRCWTGCNSCKHQREHCNYNLCGAHRSQWEWDGGERLSSVRMD